MSLADRLAALWEHSPFRAGIHLTEAERAELQSIGIPSAAERSRPLLAARLGPGHRVVTVQPDSGMKYLAGNVYDTSR